MTEPTERETIRTLFRLVRDLQRRTDALEHETERLRKRTSYLEGAYTP